MKFVRCKDDFDHEILINLGRVRRVAIRGEKDDVVHTVDGDVLAVNDELQTGKFENAIIDI